MYLRATAFCRLLIFFAFVLLMAGSAQAVSPLSRQTVPDPVAHQYLHRVADAGLSITNGSDAPITVVAIGEGDAQQALGEVAAGETLAVDVPAGTTLGFAQGDAWLGDGYLVSGAEGEAVSVPYLAPADAAGAATDDAAAAAGTDPGQPAVEILNSTDAPITVIVIGENDEQTVLGELDPGTSYSQPASAGTVFAFAQNDAWLGDAYVTGGIEGETVSIPYYAQAMQDQPAEEQPDGMQPDQAAEGAAPADPGAPQLQITNGSDGPVTVVAIGENDQQTALVEIPAGETVSQPVDAGTTLGFAQNDAWLGDAYTVEGLDGEAVTLPYVAEAAPAATDQEGNLEQQPATEDGALLPPTEDGALLPPTEDGALLPPTEDGALLPPTEDGSVLPPADEAGASEPLPPAEEKAGGELAAAPAEAVTVADGQRAVEISNRTDFPVTVIAIGENDEQQVLTEIPAGADGKVPALAGMVLGFAQNDAWLGDAYTVTGEEGERVRMPFTAKAAATAAEKKQPPIMIENSTGAPVTVIAIGADDTQETLGEVAAGDKRRLPAAPGTVLGFAQGDNWVGKPYTTAGAKGETVTVPYEPLTETQIKQQGEGSVAITFNNPNGSPLIVVVTDDQNNAEVLYELPVMAETTKRALPKSTLWFYVKGNEEQPVGDPYVVPDADAKIEVPYDRKAGIIAAQQGPGSVAIAFANTRMTPVVVTVVDAENIATPLLEIPMGQIVTQNVLPGSVLWFYEKGADQPFDTPYVVAAEPEQVNIPYSAAEALVAKQSGPGSIELEVHNETFLDAYVTLLDAENKRVDLATIKYRNAFNANGVGTTIRAQPGTTLYFYSGFYGGDQVFEGQYTVAADGPTILHIPFQQDMETQKNAKPAGSVLVKFKSKATTDDPLLFVDVGGRNMFTLRRSLETYRYLLPGTTLFAFQPKTPGGSDYDAIGDQIVVGGDATQSFDCPTFQNATAEDLIKAGKVDVKAIAAQITTSIIQERLKEKNSAKVCWRDTYTRGVGVVPRNCGPGREEATAGLCYDKCPAGYSGFANTCFQQCPAGYRDDGLTCWKPGPYARDAYPWEFGDWFDMDGAMARCRKDHGNNCVLANANTMVYETCRAGYHQAPVITNLCSPDCPAGMTDGGAFCGKNTIQRNVGLMECNSNQQYDAGLCYDGCRSGYAGVGPVCWNSCPAKLPVNCGASCAATKGDCALAITDQVTTPFMVAANITMIALTAGAGAGATAGANAGKAGGKVAATTGTQALGKAAAKEFGKQGFKALVRSALKGAAGGAAKAAFKDMAIDTAVAAALTGAFTVGFNEKAKADLKEQLTKQVNEQLAGSISDAEIDAIINTVAEGAGGGVDFQWESLDPTGIADVVRSYNLPICSNVK